MNNDFNKAELAPKGLFISFEGTEGVGKTTAIEGLLKRLDEQGIEYVKTREPGGSAFAETIRSMLLDPDTKINDDTELLMVFAARSDHLSEVINPALNAGKWVICDRFYDSSFAYQGFGRGYGDPDVVAKINALVKVFVNRVPDLTLWLDLPLLEGMERAGKRGKLDRFESEKGLFFNRVYEGFEYQANNNKDRIKRIDASGGVEDVATRVWHAVTALKKSNDKVMTQ